MGKRIFGILTKKMYRELNRLRRLYPGRMTLETAGRSRDGRKIPRVILGAENAKYRVCVQAAIHGREYMNSALAVRQIRDYLSEERTDFFAEVCFCVFPMMNPDGVTICQKGITGIRNQIFRDRVQECFCRDMEIYVRDKAAGKKIPTGSEEKRYFRRWKANAGGVDLNRNFDAGWAEYNGRAKPSSEGCKGACPGSEPEARILINNVTETKYDCCISYHSAGNLIYWDFGSHGILRDKERRLAETVAAVTGYLPERAVQETQTERDSVITLLHPEFPQ